MENEINDAFVEPLMDAERRPIKEYAFADGAIDTSLGIGWDAVDGDFRWLSGFASEIWLEHPGSGPDFILELDMQAGEGVGQHAQRLLVTVRETVVGRSVLTGRRSLRYHVPGETVSARGPVRIRLQHEDAVSLSPHGTQDVRRSAPLRCFGLRLWSTSLPPSTRELESKHGVEASDTVKLTGLRADLLVSMFESLGDNCEFGIVQRRCGAEPLSLMRFGAPPWDRLLLCLQTRFEHLGAAENLLLVLSGDPPREYSIKDKRYGMIYHTFQYEDKVDGDELLSKQPARLRLLSRKLVEDLQDGQKLFVWKETKGIIQEDGVRQLHAAIQAYADNTLLWVTVADEAHPPGTVEWISRKLMKGYVYRFAPPQAVPKVDLPSWLLLCVNAYLLAKSASDADGDAAPAMPVGSAQFPVPPRLFLPEPVTAQGVAHVQNRGDTQSGSDGWIGAFGSGLAIEGLSMSVPLALRPGELTYQLGLRDGSLSEEADMGQFRGTRGKNSPVSGILVKVSRDLASLVSVVLEVRFTDGLQLEALLDGSVCQSPSNASLEAVRLTAKSLS